MRLGRIPRKHSVWKSSLAYFERRRLPGGADLAAMLLIYNLGQWPMELTTALTQFTPWHRTGRFLVMRDSRSGISSRIATV